MVAVTERCHAGKTLELSEFGVWGLGLGAWGYLGESLRAAARGSVCSFALSFALSSGAA